MANEAPNAAVIERQPKFHFQMLGILALLFVFSSLLEADRRGLLFDADPFAFAVDDTAFILDGSSELEVGVIRLANIGRSDRIGASRNTDPRYNRLLRSGSDRAGSAPGVTGDPVSPPFGIRNPSLSAPLRPPALSGTSSTGAPSPLAIGSSVPGGGFTPGPIGFIPASNGSNPPPSGVTDPDPVVPAIPEPASWLLMIIGVSWLGFVLRKGHVTVVMPRSHA